MERFFTHRSKSINVYKTFWREKSWKKRSKPVLGQYTFKKKFKKTIKKKKYMRSKSMFFQFSTYIEKPSNEFNTISDFKEYIFNCLLDFRREYIVKVKAIRRKVASDT